MLTKRGENVYFDIKMLYAKLINDAPYAVEVKVGDKIEIFAPSRVDQSRFIVETDESYDRIRKLFLNEDTPFFASPEHHIHSWGTQQIMNGKGFASNFMAVCGPDLYAALCKLNMRHVVSYRLYGEGSYLKQYAYLMLPYVKSAADEMLYKKIGVSTRPLDMWSLTPNVYKEATARFMVDKFDAEIFLNNYYGGKSFHFLTRYMGNNISTFLECRQELSVPNEPQPPLPVVKKERDKYIQSFVSKHLNGVLQFLKKKVVYCLRKKPNQLNINGEFIEADESALQMVELLTEDEPIPPPPSFPPPPPSVRPPMPPSLASIPDRAYLRPLEVPSTRINLPPVVPLTTASDVPKTKESLNKIAFIKRKGLITHLVRERFDIGEFFIMLVKVFGVAILDEYQMRPKQRFQLIKNIYAEALVFKRDYILGPNLAVMRDWFDDQKGQEFAVAVAVIFIILEEDASVLKGFFSNKQIEFLNKATLYDIQPKDLVERVCYGLGVDYNPPSPPPPPTPLPPPIVPPPSLPDYSGPPPIPPEDYKLLVKWLKSGVTDAKAAIAVACQEEFYRYLGIYLQSITHNHAASVASQQFRSITDWHAAINRKEN
jgi:hypothetical protein